MKNLQLYCLILVISIFTTSIYITFSFKDKYVYNDLRTRVTGTRLLNHNRSAYFDNWKPGDPTIFQNHTRNVSQIINGNTVTPAVLVITKPLHQLSLYTITSIWYFGSYVALAFILLLMLHFAYTSKNKHYTILVVIASLFALMAGWKMHCNTGQIYVFYTSMAISSFYFFYKKKVILAALIAAVVTLCRLPFALLFIPLILFGQNKRFIVTYITTILLAIVYINTTHYGLWQQYFDAMQYYALENDNAIPKNENFVALPYTTMFEGIPNMLQSTSVMQYVDSLKPDIFSLQKLLVKLQIPHSPKIMYALFGLFALLLFAFINHFNKYFYYHQKLMNLYCCILMLCFDYFIPALRFNYNFIQFLILLSLLLFNKLTVSKASLYLLTFGVLLNIYKLPFLSDAYSIGEVFCIFAATLVLVTNKVQVPNEVFKYNWIGRYCATLLGLHPKMGSYR